MKTNVLILFLMAFFISSNSFAQGQKIIYAEALGATIFAGVNFDMRFKKESREGLGLRAGIGSAKLLGLEYDVTIIPVGVNYVYGSHKSALLVGANASFGIYKTEDKFETNKYGAFVPSLEVGYRFRPLVKGVAFQVTYNPLFNTVGGAYPAWFGIGLGYSW